MIIADTLSQPRTVASLLPSDRLLWVALTVIAACLPPLEHLLSLNITGLPQVLAIAAAILALRAVYLAVRPGAQVVHRLLENWAGIIAYTAIVAPVSYLCARNSRPLFNDALLAADRWLGYDWHAWADFENGTPAIALVLRLAYASLLPQTVLVLTILPLVGDGRRGFSLIRASLIAVIIACAGSWVLPSAMPEAGNTSWYAHWSALRTTAPFAIPLSDVEGVIGFPSFHASAAILMLYAVRGLGALTVGFCVVELLMLVSTTTYGVHYFFDVVAGIIVAVFAIWLTSRLDRMFPVREPGVMVNRLV
ncbi:MAG: phosphatase PAP2 family protein [Pseudomonadota bacterium]|nr:phosphatase PAP2 family protein [Pseudomonadota bacterium]